MTWGYDSRTDMIRAWGFSYDPTKAGAPPTLDYEAVLAEIARRYKDKPKPKTASQLSDENPDLKTQIHTLSTNGRKYFGRTFGREIVARGLLDKPPVRGDLGPVEVLDELALRYEGKPKPKTVAQLFDENPDLKVFKSTLNARAKDLFGRTLGDELVGGTRGKESPRS